MRKTRKKILLIDEQQVIRMLVYSMLNKSCDIQEAENTQYAYSLMEKCNDDFSAILLYLDAEDRGSFIQYEKFHHLFNQIPVFVFTNTTDAVFIRQILSVGVVRVFYPIFEPDIIQMEIHNVIKLQLNMAIHKAAQSDSLTGLYNREAFFSEAEKKVRTHKAGYYVIASLDIDSFKLINNQYGMAKGDEVLRSIADIFQRNLSIYGGICARFAADSFALLYPRSLLKSGVLKKIDEQIRSQGALFATITVNVGRYIINELNDTIEVMYDYAMLAMISAKRTPGKNAVMYSEEMRSHMLIEKEIADEMKNALYEGQFEVWLQPQYNHATGALIGAEALTRWNHPTKGLIMPIEFIPIFEKNGFIYEMDQYIWEQCCRMIYLWREQGRKLLPISVNISPHDLINKDFADTIINLVKKYDIPVEMLHLEITTFTYPETIEYTVKIVQRLIDYGFIIELDDFGGAYSVVSILKDLPIQIMKLDIRGLQNQNVNRIGSIIESIIRMAKWLDMAVIAEGVEDEKTADFLQSIDCYYVQGLLYSPAIIREKYEQLLENSSKETSLNRIKTIQRFDNIAFWNPQSIETLIFNSYVGGACIFEYFHGEIELLRVNKMYEKEIGMPLYRDKTIHGLNNEKYLDIENRNLLISSIKKAVENREEATFELRLVDSNSQETHIEYVLVTLRVVAEASERYLIYCIIVNRTKQHLAEQEKWDAIRKQAETDNQLRIILENINAGVSAVSRDSNNKLYYIYTNDKFYQIYGYTKEQFETEVRDATNEIILPEYREMLMERINDARRLHGTIQVDYQARQRNGNIVWIRAKLGVCFLQTQDIPVYVIVYNDISVEKRNYIRSHELNKQLSSYEISLQINLLKKEIIEFRSLYATEEEKNQFISNSLYYEKYMKQVVYTEEYEAVCDALSFEGLLRHYNEGDLKYSVEYRKKVLSGEMRWFVATVVLMDEPVEGEVTAFIYSRDIDARMKRRIARNQIVDSEVEDISIINIATEYCEVLGIYYDSVIEAGRTNYYENLERYISNEVAKEDVQRCREFFTIDNMVRSVNEKGYADESYWLVTADGGNRRKNARITYLDSTHEDLLMVGRDITELFEQEQERQMVLQQAVDMANYANQAKSDFLSRMSHDMRTPLNSIIGLTQLEKEKSNSEEMMQYIKRIDNSSQYLLELINNNLDLSKIESGKMELHREPFYLEDFILGIDTVIRPQMDEKNIDFIMNLKDEITCILVDKVRFTQVFYNLLSNAAKYTPEGGRVEFYDEVIPQKDGKRGMRFYIKDNGIGISREFQKILFDPFSQEYSVVQKERKGTGLGLAIVKQIIELAGGNIEVISELNHGTTFVVDLYAECLEADTGKDTVVCDYTKLAGLHVLVVDDNEINRLILRNNLEPRGCIISNASDGKEAVNAVRSSEEGYYDVILTDINMPIMNGLEEARQIRALPRNDVKDIIIIALTADAYSDILEKIRRAGMNARVLKPFVPKTLYETIISEISSKDLN